MLSLLRKSTLLQQFNNNERIEVRGALLEKYKPTYENYYNTLAPTEELMETVVDMYLFLGISPSNKLKRDLKRYLLEGKVFSKLDIYMHLPRYEQIVKLLAPKYYVDVDYTQFRIFTINELIYNIASERYLIKDEYINAYSPWYIQRLVSKGIKASSEDLCYLLKHAPPECALCVLKSNAFTSYSEIVIEEVVKRNNMECFKYLLSSGDYLDSAILYSIYYNNKDMIQYLGPTVDLHGASIDSFAKDKRIDILMRIKEINSDNLSNYLKCAIQMNWVEGIEFIEEYHPLTTHDLWYAYTCQSDSVKLIYNKIAHNKGPQYIINDIIIYNIDFIKTVYSWHTVKIDSTISLGSARSIDVIEFYLSKGCTIIEDHILTAIYNGNEEIIQYLIDRYGKIDSSFMEYAIDKNNISILRYIINNGGSWDKSYPGLAAKKGLKDTCIWLVYNGCPIDPEDIHLMPAELNFETKGIIIQNKKN